MALLDSSIARANGKRGIKWHQHRYEMTRRGVVCASSSYLFPHNLLDHMLDFLRDVRCFTVINLHLRFSSIRRGRGLVRSDHTAPAQHGRQRWQEGEVVGWACAP